MEIAILGQKVRVEIVVLAMLVGMFISLNMFCSCAGGVKEGFEDVMKVSGAAVDYVMGKDVKGSWTSGPVEKRDYDSWYGHLEGHKGAHPMESDKMYMFGENKFDADCCPSTYSSSTGCACLSPEQAKHLNERGGNRTLPGEY